MLALGNSYDWSSLPDLLGAEKCSLPCMWGSVMALRSRRVQGVKGSLAETGMQIDNKN
jgi:hypothetical protein